ncbi:MAG TPA: penicillin-insensitive murein endopeptidase [Magnetospirillum sp.]|nr:penicillin-insensitive murein endopeptidase [Magnetospirillum sp.]
MRRKMAAAVAAVVVAGAAACAQAGSAADPWSAVKLPVSGGAQSMGSPAAGCISGAVALPLDGAGYQVLRPQRNRFWAHPRTVAFVQSLGRSAAAAGFGPLLIGDLSQPRGGPMAFGHGSHQNGLDVDIWFRLPGRSLTDGQLEQPEPVSMVKGTHVDPDTWTATHFRLLKMAAASPEVERIFVNPPIKAEACRRAVGDRAWLAKLRPWWGHDEHFHVRLSCTPGDIGCVPQAPVPDGDGCGEELASWNAKPVVLPASAKDKPNHRNPVLPTACADILHVPGVTEAGAR